MGKTKTKIDAAETFTLSHFVSWVASSESFKAKNTECVEPWARHFVQLIKENLVQHRSMAFTPVGHLVVAKKGCRQLRLPNGQLCESQEGVSVRFRGRPCGLAAYIKRADWAKIMDGQMHPPTKAERLALYDCWVDFLAHAIASKARIEIRGLGGFHLHQRNSVHTNLSQIKTKNTEKVYLRFAPSKSLMIAMNHKT